MTLMTPAIRAALGRLNSFFKKRFFKPVHNWPAAILYDFLHIIKNAFIHYVYPISLINFFWPSNQEEDIDTLFPSLNIFIDFIKTFYLFIRYLLPLFILMSMLNNPTALLLTGFVLGVVLAFTAVLSLLAVIVSCFNSLKGLFYIRGVAQEHFICLKEVIQNHLKEMNSLITFQPGTFIHHQQHLQLIKESLEQAVHTLRISLQALNRHLPSSCYDELIEKVLAYQDALKTSFIEKIHECIREALIFHDFSHKNFSTLERYKQYQQQLILLKEESGFHSHDSLFECKTFAEYFIAMIEKHQERALLYRDLTPLMLSTAPYQTLKLGSSFEDIFLKELSIIHCLDLLEAEAFEHGLTRAAIHELLDWLKDYLFHKKNRCAQKPHIGTYVTEHFIHVIEKLSTTPRSFQDYHASFTNHLILFKESNTLIEKEYPRKNLNALTDCIHINKERNVC
jgi:hypothetical protein